MKTRKCPNCRNTPYSYSEVWGGHTISFLADKDGVPDEKGAKSDGGYPTHVEAHCICGYVWRLKGVVQITELRPGTEQEVGDERN